MIEAGDLPQDLEDEVGRQLADYTIAFIRRALSTSVRQPASAFTVATRRC